MPLMYILYTYQWLIYFATVSLYLLILLSNCFPPPTYILSGKHMFSASLNMSISVRFQGKPFNIMVFQAYAPTSNTEEAEVERFHEDLQDLLELTPKKDILFIIGYAKVGSQETPGVTGKFGLGVQIEAGQTLIEFCQEATLVIANTLFHQHKRILYTWTSPDGQY